MQTKKAPTLFIRLFEKNRVDNYTYTEEENGIRVQYVLPHGKTDLLFDISDNSEEMQAEIRRALQEQQPIVLSLDVSTDIEYTQKALRRLERKESR